jgi:hypothetical protein
LRLAAKDRRKKIVQLLLEQGADNRDHLRFAMESAAITGQANVVRVHCQQGVYPVLCQQGVDPNTKYYDWLTSLQLAAGVRACEVGRALLQAEVDLEAKSKKFRTSLHVAAPKYSFINLLLDHGAETRPSIPLFVSVTGMPRRYYCAGART